jgi:MraZ protein
MLTRKTQYAWMALGGLICLFGLVLACKLRDGNKAIAQPEKMDLPLLLTSQEEKQLASPPPALMGKDAPTPPASLLPMPTMEPKKSPPSKSEKPEDSLKEKLSEPKATLNMPFPAEPPSLPMPGTAKVSSPPPPIDRGHDPLEPPPSISGSPVVPASFGPDTPPPPDKKPKDPLPSKTEVEKSKSPANVGEAAGKPALTPSDVAGSAQTKVPPPVERAKTTENKPVSSLPPSWNAPVNVKPPSTEHNDQDSGRTQPGEPPLAPAPGPVQLYHVHNRETLQDIARRTLGSSERWGDLHKLNPTIQPDTPLTAGTTVRLPADACFQTDDGEPVKPLPTLRPKPAAPKAKALPLTGTYQCSLDEKGQLTLPRALRDQLSGSDTVLLSPGPDKCLWLTNQPHLERLGERLDQSQANEADVRVFKRLYFAQTEKLSINGDGRVIVPERLREFAELHQEVVLVGIDDHFEVWDASRWRSYTQQKSAGRYATTAEQE